MKIAAIDIGGGSMQLVVADRARLLETHSVPLGALRLAETFPGSDPPSRRDLQRLRRHIRRVAAAALRAVSERGVVRVVGSSGSIHALAQLAHQEDAGSPIAHINGYELRLGALERVSRRLQRLPLSSIERLPGLDARRAEIILPGALVLTHVLKAVGAESIVMSDFGVREGLVTDYLTSHAGEISALGNVEDLRLRSVLQLLQKYQPDERQMRHARHVARLSLALFDGLRRTHGLEPDAREVLHFAALLHDVGALVGYDGHADHSYYLIKHGNLRGVSAEELETIAVVARYHGKNRPRKRDQAFRAMRKRDRRMVRWLAAILQIAEGLDRSHYQLVQGLRVVRRGDRLSILIATRRSAGLELWAARRRTRLLEKLIRARVRVAPDPALDAGRERAAPARARSETKPVRAKVLPLRVRPGGFCGVRLDDPAQPLHRLIRLLAELPREIAQPARGLRLRKLQPLRRAQHEIAREVAIVPQSEQLLHRDEPLERRRIRRPLARREALERVARTLDRDARLVERVVVPARERAAPASHSAARNSGSRVARDSSARRRRRMARATRAREQALAARRSRRTRRRSSRASSEAVAGGAGVAGACSRCASSAAFTWHSRAGPRARRIARTARRARRRARAGTSPRRRSSAASSRRPLTRVS